MSVEHGTYLGKAIKPSHEHDIWLPFDSLYLADLVEAFNREAIMGSIRVTVATQELLAKVCRGRAK